MVNAKPKYLVLVIYRAEDRDLYYEEKIVERAGKKPVDGSSNVYPKFSTHNLKFGFDSLKGAMQAINKLRRLKKISLNLLEYVPKRVIPAHYAPIVPED